MCKEKKDMGLSSSKEFLVTSPPQKNNKHVNILICADDIMNKYENFQQELSNALCDPLQEKNCDVVVNIRDTGKMGSYNRADIFILCKREEKRFDDTVINNRNFQKQKSMAKYTAIVRSNPSTIPNPPKFENSGVDIYTLKTDMNHGLMHGSPNDPLLKEIVEKILSVV